MNKSYNELIVSELDSINKKYDRIIYNNSNIKDKSEIFTKKDINNHIRETLSNGTTRVLDSWIKWFNNPTNNKQSTQYLYIKEDLTFALLKSKIADRKNKLKKI